MEVSSPIRRILNDRTIGVIGSSQVVGMCAEFPQQAAAAHDAAEFEHLGSTWQMSFGMRWIECGIVVTGSSQVWGAFTGQTATDRAARRFEGH